MRLHLSIIALSLVAGLSVLSFAQEPSQDQIPSERATAEDDNPMTEFARMVGGEWKMTLKSGTSLYDSWHWGPGKRSLRVMTDGLSADGTPWSTLEVVYWHPRHKQVRLLNMHPDVLGVGRGVGEGTFTFKGENAEAIFDLYQPLGRRDIARRWKFDGPDKYHAILLEATGPAGYKPLAEWDYARSKTLTQRTVDGSPKPSERLKAFEHWMGHTWEATGKWVNGIAVHTQATVEWVPLLDAVYLRILSPRTGNEPEHLLDAYFYHHLGVDRLRCLALSNTGGVYEGDIAVLDDGALQLELKCYEGEQVTDHVIRFEFESNGSIRQRVWSQKGTERTLKLDILHNKIER